MVCVSRTQDSLQNGLQSEVKEVLSQVKRKRPRYIKTTEELMSSQLREREREREKEEIRFPKAKAWTSSATKYIIRVVVYTPKESDKYQRTILI